MCVDNFFQLRRLEVFGWGLTVGSVLVVDMALSCSILVLMLAMRKIQILAHMGEYDLGLERGEV